MKTIYVAKDGTQFERVYDCFNHEWREFFPDVKVFDHTDSLTSDVIDAVTIRVHNLAEFEFVHDYLCEITGMDYIPGIGNSSEGDGVFWRCDDDPEFVPRVHVPDELVLFEGDDSDLALEFEEILPELPEDGDEEV